MANKLKRHRKTKAVIAGAIGAVTSATAISSNLTVKNNQDLEISSLANDEISLGTEKIDVEKLFANYVSPIVEQFFPTSSEIIEAIKQSNPELNAAWEELDVSYNGDATVLIQAKSDSVIYKNSTVKHLSPKIIATPSTTILNNVGDTILISANLSGLWKSAYHWNYKIEADLNECLNIVQDYNSQTIAFTLKSKYYGEIGSFDVSCTILEVAKSNTLTIEVPSSGIYIVDNQTLVNVGDVVNVFYSIKNVDGSCWKYSTSNPEFEKYVSVYRQSNNFIFSLQKEWNYDETTIQAWYEKDGTTTNKVSFNIKPNSNFQLEQNIELGLNGDAHGENRVDGASSIDSVGAYTHIHRFHLNFQFSNSNFDSFKNKKSIAALLNNGTIKDLNMKIKSDSTNREFYVHHTWTASTSGYPSEDIYHPFVISNVIGNSIVCEEYILNVPSSAGQSGVTAYIQPQLNLSKAYVQWDPNTNKFTYSFDETAFYCKNTFWKDLGWFERPIFLG